MKGRPRAYSATNVPKHESRLTHHGPEARAPVSVAGLGRRWGGWRGAEGAIAEVGAWAGFVAKTPHTKHFLPDFSDEETDHRYDFLTAEKT